MLYSGTDPESYITEYNLVYEDYEPGFVQTFHREGRGWHTRVQRDLGLHEGLYHRWRTGVPRS